MKIGILKENEHRVAMLPELVVSLLGMKVAVLVEQGAGTGAFFSDEAYKAAGAQVVERNELIGQADLLIGIHAPEKQDIGLFKKGQVFLAAFNPYFNQETVSSLAGAGLTLFSMDMVPRTTRAQAMDILSSMATVSGYKAVLTAANELPKFFPMFMTAAGTITPAKVLILGAGVAGLQAIATARRLGAVVEVFDVRAAVKEEVTGLGGKFVEVEGATDDRAAGGYAVEQGEEFKQRQAQVIHEHALKSDVVICTAQIPGRKAPLLLKKATVEAMKPGAVIIDLAASSGGNCELTVDQQTILTNGVKIIGKSNFPNDLPADASKMFGKNVMNFLKLLINKEGELLLNWEDELVMGTAIAHDGRITNEKLQQAYNLK